jgi:hypothetical protein
VKAHRVVGRRGSHIFLDSLLTDNGEFVSLTHRPRFTPPPQEVSWYSFLFKHKQFFYYRITSPSQRIPVLRETWPVQFSE